MICPDTIEAPYPNRNSTEGIISKFRNLNPNEKIESVFVPTSTSIDNGNLNTLLYWNSGVQLRQSSSSFFEIEFKDYFIFPLGYSLRGFQSKHFALRWKFSGYTEDHSKEVSFGSYKSEGSGFCGTGSVCSSNSWGTFQNNRQKNCFRFLRWTFEEGSFSLKYFALGGIEVFGILSRSPTTIFRTLNSGCTKAQSFYLKSFTIYILLLVL